MQSVSSNAVATALQGYATTSTVNTALGYKAYRNWWLLGLNQYVDTHVSSAGDVSLCILSYGSAVALYALYEHGAAQKSRLAGYDFEGQSWVQFSYVAYGVWRITAKQDSLAVVLIQGNRT